LPPDAPSQPRDERLGRQFNAFRWPHPITGEPLGVPASDSAATDTGGGGIEQVAARRADPT
jgi:hypothetical protein